MLLGLDVLKGAGRVLTHEDERGSWRRSRERAIRWLPDGLSGGCL